jgi:putative phosphoesterase
MARRSRTPRRQLHESASLAIPKDRPLTLAIVADTHSNPHPEAAGLIGREEPDAILHAGDIGELDVLDGLREIAPLIAVRGNIDAPGAAPDSIDLSISSAGEIRLRILLTHIAVNGPRLRVDAARLAKKHGAAMVVCGHSHVPFVGHDRGLDVFNPGSIGPRRFRLPIVFGLMTVRDDGVGVEHISCETGQRWSP